MNKPKMVLFDFGETLITETFNPYEGTKAVIEKATKNPNHVSFNEVQKFADELIQNMRKCDSCSNLNILETHNFHFTRYLYEYFGIEFDISPYEIEQTFFNASTNSYPTPNIEELLRYFDEMGIRTGVISNMSFSEKTLKNWIQRDLPTNRFEFIIASSEYVFRKPSKYIFEIALRKAQLSTDKVWYCGNNYFYDIGGAYKSGLYPIWYKGAKWESENEGVNYPNTEIYDWNELKNIIATCE